MNNNIFKDLENNENSELTKTINSFKLKLFALLMLSIVTASLVFYFMIQQNNVTRVFWNGQYFDKPRELLTIEQNEETILTDRWLRPFVSDFIRFRWPDKENDKKYLLHALKWQKVSCENRSCLSRAEGLMNDIENYNISLKQKQSKFWVRLIPSVKIRPSQINSSGFYVELDGLFSFKSETKAKTRLAKLKMEIIDVGADKSRNEDGYINHTGLKVLTANIEYVDDYTTGELIIRDVFTEQEEIVKLNKDIKNE